MSREEKDSLNLQGYLSKKIKKEDDNDFIYFMKQMDKSDWTDEQKVRLIKITCRKVIGRRQQRRINFIDRKMENNDSGSGKTTRLMLDISVGEWCEYLFNGFKKRYPDDTNDSLTKVLCNTDAEIDEINSCHASTADIKSQLVLWNLRNSQLFFACDNRSKGANTMSDEFINDIYEHIIKYYKSNINEAHELVSAFIKTNKYVTDELQEYSSINAADWREWYAVELGHGKYKIGLSGMK